MSKFTLQAGSLTQKSERSRRRVQRLLSRAHRRMAATAATIAQAKLSEEKQALAKATDSNKLADEIMAALQEEFAALATGLKQPLMDSAMSGVSESALQFDISDAGMLATSNDVARAWAKDRAAELVGMKWINGELLPNLNAKWAITDTIRDELRKILEDAFSKEIPLDEVIQQIKEAGSFSESRSEMIARSEISRSQVQGELATWKASGMVLTYGWILSEDEDICDECISIEDGTSEWGEPPWEFGKGPIPLDDTHPRCRCGLISVEIEEPKAASQKSSINKSSGEEPLEVEMLQTEKSSLSGDLRLAFPITKIDEEKRMVYATMTTEDLDSQGDITDYDAACKALESWPGNVREQHDPKKAVGSALEIMKDDKARKIDVGIYVSKGAPDTWEKVLDKTLRGASIGVPVGKFRREATTAKVAKTDGQTEEVKCNRLFVETYSELSLVDNPANPAAQIYLVKSQDGGLVATDQLGQAAEKSEESAVEKLTEGASDYADPGWQEDKKKRYPLNTEERVVAAARYFGRPRNRKKYSADQQKKIDAKIEAAKKKFKIGEYADKAASFFSRIQKQDDGSKKELPWVPMSEPVAGDQAGMIIYMPRTFGDVWEDIELAEELPDMLEMLKRTLENIIMYSSGVDAKTKRQLCMDSIQEFFEEMDEELSEQVDMEAGKAAAADVKKAGARHSKEDLGAIQAAHDQLVKAGAICKQEEKSVVVAMTKKEFEDVMKIAAKEAMAEVVTKAAPGLTADQATEIAKTQTLEAKIELETKLAEKADKSEVAKVSEITSKHEGDLSAVRADLELVKKEPASLPIVKIQQAEKILQGQAGIAGDDPDDAALIELNKRYDSEPVGILKNQLGHQIAQLEIKAARRKAAMR